MGEKFNKLFSKMNYSTYDNIQRKMGTVNISACVTSLLNDKPIIDKVCYVLIFLSCVARSYMALSDGKTYTKDVTKVREDYDEFVKKYNELNKYFDFDNPIQIYTMYTYLLNNGYISRGKDFEFSDDSHDVESLFGANVLNGKGVCRHIALLLTDILNDYGIEAANLPVYLGNFRIGARILDEKKYSIEELNDWIELHESDDEKIIKLFEMINKLIGGLQIGIEFYYAPDKKQHLFIHRSNHVITSAVKDDHFYFLDPTNSKVLKRSEEDKRLLVNDGYIEVIKAGRSYGIDNYRRLKNALNGDYTNIPDEESNKMIKDTLKICKSHKGMFDEFYSDNKRLIKKVANGLMNI